MRSVTGGRAHAGHTTLGTWVGSGPVGRVPAPDHACRWCGLPPTWAWSLGGQEPGDLRERGVREVRVCDDCQALTIAGDDAALLDRCMAAVTAWAYPVAVDFLREQHAAALAQFVLRRTTVRTLDPVPGSVPGARPARSADDVATHVRRAVR